MKQTKYLLFALYAVSSSLIFFSGCVSVNIGGKAPQKSQGTGYTEPPSPFKKIDSDRADGVWRNSGNGNTISFLSTCHDPADPSLESIFKEFTADLVQLEIVKNESIDFHGRAALSATVKGMLDGVSTQLEVLVFKKNNCIYSLSYVGISKYFALDQAHFTAFTEGFHAP